MNGCSQRRVVVDVECQQIGEIDVDRVRERIDREDQLRRDELVSTDIDRCDSADVTVADASASADEVRFGPSALPRSTTKSSSGVGETAVSTANGDP